MLFKKAMQLLRKDGATLFILWATAEIFSNMRSCWSFVILLIFLFSSLSSSWNGPQNYRGPQEIQRGLTSQAWRTASPLTYHHNLRKNVDCRSRSHHWTWRIPGAQIRDLLGWAVPQVSFADTRTTRQGGRGWCSPVSGVRVLAEELQIVPAVPDQEMAQDIQCSPNWMHQRAHEWVTDVLISQSVMQKYQLSFTTPLEKSCKFTHLWLAPRHLRPVPMIIDTRLCHTLHVNRIIGYRKTVSKTYIHCALAIKFFSAC